MKYTNNESDFWMECDPNIYFEKEDLTAIWNLIKRIFNFIRKLITGKEKK